MRQFFKGYHNFLKERFGGDKSVLIVELAYVLFCLASGIYFAAFGKIQNMVMAFAFPLTALVVNIIEWKAKIRCGTLFLVLFFLMALSNILGNGYGLYSLFFPYFDKVMHTLSGIICTCFGYALMKKIVGGDAGKNFVFCLFFGLMFAMAVASLWEVYEYFVSEVLHDDMQTNYIVNTIDYSGYITGTTIYFTDGSTLEIVDGYIDIGLFDTLQDITVCLAGSLVTIALLMLDNSCFKRVINRLIVPRIIDMDTALTFGETDEKSITDQKTA